MPRFYFHVRDGQDYPDLQGSVFPDLETARKEAIRFAGALLQDNSPSTNFWNGGEWTLTVTDEDKLVLFKLVFFGSNAMATAPLSAPVIPPGDE